MQKGECIISEKILIVDDEPEIANLIEVYLNSEGYTVFKFYSAKDALACTETIDLNLAILDVMIPDIDGSTYNVYLWLQENSYKYGFIFRYPGNKTEITGTAEEVWHYRYVGKDAAAEIHAKGICLEEYLESLYGSN